MWNRNQCVAVKTSSLNQWWLNMQKEKTSKTWLGNSLLWNRMYSAGINKRDYWWRKKIQTKKNHQMTKRSLRQKIEASYIIIIIIIIINIIL